MCMERTHKLVVEEDTQWGRYHIVAIKVPSTKVLDLYYVNVNSGRHSCVIVDVTLGTTWIWYDGLISFRFYGHYMMISHVNN